MASHKTTAVILAGGEGRRLGGAVKAELRIGGITLLARVLHALRGIDGAVLIAPGPHKLRSNYPTVADPSGLSGPLAGILAAADVRTEFLLSVGVDTPFFPPAFAARAMAAIGEAEVAIARYAGQAYYTNALWRVEALRRAARRDPAELSAMGIKGLVSDLDAVWIDWPEGPEGDPFANVNTRDNLIALERRAAEFGVGKAGQNR
jgi:molybdopterin-guanine dinucleotide biosynthesis protein A